MKVQLKLNSTILHGVGSGPESGAIDVIYSYWLTEFGQDAYKDIFINQIGHDLDELVMAEPGKKIFVNIKYPAYNDFESKSTHEKNLIRLDVIHQGLLRISNKYGKFDQQKLEQIRDIIISNNFLFDFVLKVFKYPKEENCFAKIVVQPLIDKFEYYLVLEDNQTEKCKIHLYCGLTNLFYVSNLFSKVKWKSKDELFIYDKANEVEIKIISDGCKIHFKNLSKYQKPPYFEMMKADISEEERRNAYTDWVHSLPPSGSALLNYQPN